MDERLQRALQEARYAGIKLIPAPSDKIIDHIKNTYFVQFILEIIGEYNASPENSNSYVGSKEVINWLTTFVPEKMLICNEYNPNYIKNIKCNLLGGHLGNHARITPKKKIYWERF